MVPRQNRYIMANTLKPTAICLLVTCLCLGTACRKVTVDFSYSPTNPKAGQTVTFTNLSLNGEDYAWDFGDNGSASTKGTAHAYNKAGTYMVTLTESRTHKAATHAVTVTDSLPCIGLCRDTVLAYDTLTAYACIWNPYDHPFTCRWQLDEHTQLIKGDLTDERITVRLTHAIPSGQTQTQASIRLDVTMDGITTTALAQPVIVSAPSWCVAVRTDQGDFYQRLYLPMFEDPHPVDLPVLTEALETANTGREAVDSVEHKHYHATNRGLFVENANLSHRVQLTTDSAGLVIAAMEQQRLFFTTADGVYMLPLIHSFTNQTTDTATLINTLQGVTQMVVTNDKY